MGLADNTWLVEDAEGRPVGFAMLFWGKAVHGESQVWVEGGQRGRGIEAALFEAVEARAAALAEALSDRSGGGETPGLHVFCLDVDGVSRGWLEEHGYVPVREAYEMGIALGDPPTSPSPLPAGVTVSTYDAVVDEMAAYEAQEEAFADHFLHEPSTLEQWRRHTTEPFDFDPSLWLIAWDDDEVAGEVLTLVTPEQAYVGSLSVRRPWRGRGLGLALLTRAFDLARGRGHDRVWLGVDAQNPTGALALYRKAGMQVERRYLVYAKAFG